LLEERASLATNSLHLPLTAATQASAMTCRSGQDSGSRILDYGPSMVTATAVDRVKGLVPPGTSLRARTAYSSLRGLGEVVIFSHF
jgi:hypothetical protein